jgi:dTDP-4-dehydrorhamnose 3,5-epimerase
METMSSSLSHRKRKRQSAIQVVRRTTAHRDSRGAITDVLDAERLDCVTIVTSKEGAVRGNHYHKKTIQFLYVLEGRLRVLEQRVGGPIQSRILRRGDLLTTPPMVRHALVALADCTLIVAARGPRRGDAYEVDTYRLDTPLWPRR